MRSVLTVLVCLFFSGCTYTRMYDGEKQPNDQVAIFYSNGHSSGPYMSFNVDGKRIGGGLFSPKAAFFLPGEHEITLKVMISRGMLSPSDASKAGNDFRFLRSYDFTEQLEAGYSYQLDHPGWSLSSQKFEICLYAEKHNAPGSKVSWGHENRKMSENAQKVLCKRPTMVITKDGQIDNPTTMPDIF